MVYINVILTGNIPAPYTTHGIKITYAIINGNSTVQQTDINWSKRILGKEALTQININIKILVFIAKFKGEDDTFITKS